MHLPRVLVVALLPSLAILPGCGASKGTPIPPPAASFDVTHYTGTVLSATPGSAEGLGSAPVVTVEAICLGQPPDDVLRPIASSSRMPSTVGQEAAFLPVPAALASTRIGVGKEVQDLRSRALRNQLGQSWPLGTQLGVLAAGTCLQIDVKGADPADGPVVQMIIRPVGPDLSNIEMAISARTSASESGAEFSIETAVVRVPFTSWNGIGVVAPLPGSGAVLVVVDQRPITAGAAAAAQNRAAQEMAAPRRERPVNH